MTTLPSNTGFTPVPEVEQDSKEHRRKLAKTVNRILQGKINCHLDVTLNASSTSTIIKDSRIGANSVISPAMALTSAGATAIAAGIYVAISSILPALNTIPGQATITHASNASTTQTIRFLIIN